MNGSVDKSIDYSSYISGHIYAFIYDVYMENELIMKQSQDNPNQFEVQSD